jgi:hypothetical protein
VGPTRRFHSEKVSQINPIPTNFQNIDRLRSKDAFYSLGIFVAWIDAEIAADERLLLRFHVLDHYDWDRDGVDVPIPAAVCGNEDSFLAKLAAGMLEKLRAYGRLDLDKCRVTFDDSLMNELHLQGLAKNYMTYGFIERETYV